MNWKVLGDKARAEEDGAVWARQNPNATARDLVLTITGKKRHIRCSFFDGAFEEMQRIKRQWVIACKI